MWKQEKCSSLEPHRGNIFMTQWAELGPIDVNFHLPKNLEIFEKNSADKIWSKKEATTMKYFQQVL